MKKIFFILIFMILLNGCSNKQEEVENPSVEETANEEVLEENQEIIKYSETDLGDTGSQIILTGSKGKFLDGNVIDENIFKDKLTLVNVWGTFCGPCIIEMPELQKINEEYESDTFQILGIISDTYIESEENIDSAKEIVSSSGVTYKNIIPDVVVFDSIIKNIQLLPTSFFVNENGEIVGEYMYGAKDYDFFKEQVDKQLQD